MPQTTLTYLHLRPDEDLPPLDAFPPFLAVLVVDEACEEMWRWEVCRRLARSSCRYLLAWGAGCEDWAESGEDAWLEAADYEDVPPEQLLIVTSHEDEELEEVFWFAKYRAAHRALALDRVVIVHIAGEAREQELREAYEAA